MEKFLKPCDKEFMKMAILKHEETFKQQVYELHRLYQIQKALMRGLKTKPSFDETNRSNSLQGLILNMEKPATSDPLSTWESDCNGKLEMEEERGIELTLGPSSFSSSNSTGSSHMKRTTRTRIHERSRKEMSYDIVEKEFNQTKLKHHPSWLYQSLSLNIT